MKDTMRIGNGRMLGMGRVLMACVFVVSLTSYAGASDGRTDAPRSSVEKIDRALREGAVDFEQATLLKVRAVVRPAALPEAYRADGAALDKCGMEILREAVLSRERLSGAGQAVLASELARPSTTYFFDSPDGYFRIHYSTTGSHAVPTADLNTNGIPDYVDKLADYCDSSWRQEVLQYGFYAPPSDGGIGGSSAYDIYCQSIGAYGYTAPESPGPQPWNDWTSYVVVHNNFIGFPPNDDPDGDQAGAAKATVAHEFQHSCQFAFDMGESGAWMEQCATWMEDEVFDPVNDNYNYLSGFFPVPQTGLMGTNGIHEYAAFVWPRYLSEVHGPAVIRDIWLDCIYSSALNAMESTLNGYSTSRDLAFGGFTRWNWITSTRDDGSHYEEASHYPLVTTMRSHSSYPVNGQTSSAPLAGLSSNYIQFLPGGAVGTRPLKLSVNGDDNYEFAVQVVARRTGGSYEEYTLPLDGAQDGAFTLSAFGDYQHVALVPALTDVVGSAVNYTYDACIGPLPVDLISPADGETASTPVNLEWDAVAGAVSYRVQVDQAGDFAAPMIDTVITGYTHSVEGLGEGEIFYWRATVTDACAESDWSEVRSFRASCGIAMTGDVNTDGSLAAADIIYLVNYTFAGGAEPQPLWQAGDVNCDGAVTASDIIYMVTHVFKSGPAPCDVCTIL